MSCAGPRNTNPFSVLDSLSDGLCQVSPRCNPRKGITPDPTHANHGDKRNFSHHQGGNNSHWIESAPGPKQNFRRERPPPQCCPAPLPPRLQQKGFRNSPPRPCSGIIDPCLVLAPPCSEVDLRSAQLKHEVFSALQIEPLTPLSSMHVPPPQPICTPVPSIKTTPQSVPIPPPSNENPAMLSSRHTADRQPPPSIPKGVSPTQTNLIKVRLPAPLAPPGLPRPSIRGRGRVQVLTRPLIAERPFNQAAEQANFEHYNGPVGERRISPPPPGISYSCVKLPSSKEVQKAPPSPATTVSSLSEDLSGSSSALFSDTTATSVSSYVSNVLRDRFVCRNWMKGYPCFINPCRYNHPPRPDQRAAPPTQPAQSRDQRQSSDVVKTSHNIRNQNVDSTPRKPDPPTRHVELPPRPEPLYAATISDHIKVRFDQGFEVREVVTGFESRWVHIENIAGTVTSAALNDLLAPFKVDHTSYTESGKSRTAKIQFASAMDAIKAVASLNGMEFADRIITAKLAINNSTRGSTILKDTDVQVVWECPTRVGYAGYDTLKEAKIALDTLNGFPFEYSVVSARLYEGLPCVGAYNVMFDHLPASVTEQSLRKFARSNAVMLERPKYLSLKNAINTIRTRLEDYGTLTSFDVLPPPYRDGLVKAWGRFTSPAEARAAQDDMDHRRPKAIGHTTLSCRHVLSLTHVLTAPSYRKMREDIGWLRWSWQRRYGPSVSIREKVKETPGGDGPAYIRLSSERPELLSSLKYEFEQLLHGETVTLAKKPAWDNFLVASAGYAFIAALQAKYPGIQIQVQKNRRVVSLWGPIVMRHNVRQEIVRKITELKAQQFWKIPLSGKLLGIFCSAELSTLQGLLGSENCILDFGERVLVVRGNDSAFRTACDAVQAAQSKQSDEAPSSGVACPVCFGEVVVPVSLACGHQWCRACLTGYLTSAVENKMFPLKCLGNDAMCTQCIPLGLSRQLLSAADFTAVIEAAFWVYAHSRPDEFHHCPTPDCTQVYRSAPQNSVLQCPSCLVRICPACHIEYHDGMTCEERDVAEDKLFNEWASSHDVKSCPGCQAPIERIEGCNHMTCTRCQTHSCWECLATFPRGQGIYEHMRTQHGGIGL